MLYELTPGPRLIDRGQCANCAVKKRRIIYRSRHDDARRELLEIEALLQDDRLNDDDRHALHGAQQALRNVLEDDTWHPASQTFYRIDNRPSEIISFLTH